MHRGRYANLSIATHSSLSTLAIQHRKAAVDLNESARTRTVRPRSMGSCLPAETTSSSSSAPRASARHCCSRPSASSTSEKPRRPPCHRARAGAPVGAVTADPAAPVADSTAQAGDSGAAGGAPRDHAAPARSSGSEGRRGLSGGVTLIQRLGLAANLYIHLHGLVLDGVY